jgi:hypothetical protein
MHNILNDGHVVTLHSWSGLGRSGTITQYIKDFKRIIQSPKFNHAEHLVVLSLLIASNQLPVKFGGPLSRCQLTQA